MEAEGSGGLRSQRAWKITCHGYVQTSSLVLGVCVVEAAKIWQGEAGLYLVIPTASL